MKKDADRRLFSAAEPSAFRERGSAGTFRPGTVFAGTAGSGNVFSGMTWTGIMGTGMIRHQAFGQFQGKLFNVLAQAVAQGAELLFFFLRQAGSLLFCIFVPHFFHIGNNGAAARGQGDPLDTAVVLVHRTAEKSVVFRTGEDLTQGRRAKVQGFAQFPGGNARIGCGALPANSTVGTRVRRSPHSRYTMPCS